MSESIDRQPGDGACQQARDRHLLVAALGRLTQEHRDVLGELCLRRSSVAQAAQALGIAPGTVKSRTYYALHALRLSIEELRGADWRQGPDLREGGSCH